MQIQFNYVETPWNDKSGILARIILSQRFWFLNAHTYTLNVFYYTRRIIIIMKYPNCYIIIIIIIYFFYFFIIIIIKSNWSKIFWNE